jgi:DNA gyrase subunit A
MTLATQTIGNVQEVDIAQEMQVAYLDYAMSVIVSRALPDVRDGLKPVHRRILYAMHDMGLTANKPYKKSARIVGEVLGKYHPHGDSAVYDAMVRMAQDFSLRYPLVDGQGNFGSVDGDNAAAMRYTEARLAEISDLMLTDLEKDTVDWHDNFDNTLREPDVLPAALPNLLINGASGIAVGMATNIPPHNLGEIVDALVYMLDNYSKIDHISVEDLLRFVHGPDFPTGGIVYRFRKGSQNEDNIDAITQGYATGRSRLILQAKAHFEEVSRGRTRIVVTELPYQTNKTNLLERIAMLVRDGKLEGITDMRDESDRTGMRIVIELTRTVEPKDVLADLFKYTPMQQTFGMSMLALVNGEPKVLSLKRMLQLFIEHRRIVVRRRSEHDLAKARARAHVVEGLLKALDILDEVIATIRHSQRVDTARNNLIKNFKFTEVQAQAILDMPLKRLAALERRKLQDEYKDLSKLIKFLEDLLAHPQKILGVIKTELLEIKERYADQRRTQIVERTKGTLTTIDLLPDQTVWVSVGANGELRRQPYLAPSKTSARTLAKDAEIALLTANTRDHLYLFSSDGRCGRVSIHEIPENSSKHVAEFTGFTRRNTITAALVLPRHIPEGAEGYLFLVTEQGMVKRISTPDFLTAAASEPEVIRVEDKDRLRWALATDGNQEVILISAGGQSIRFAEDEVRSMGLAAGGVGGMKLKKGDRVVSAQVVDPDGELLTVTEQGFAKRSKFTEYSRQGRNGAGIITHKLSNRTGVVVDAAVVHPDRAAFVTFITGKGTVKVTTLTEVPQSGRSTQGQRVVKLPANEIIAAVQVLHTPPSGGNNGSTPPAPVAARDKVSSISRNGKTKTTAANRGAGSQKTANSKARQPKATAQRAARQKSTPAAGASQKTQKSTRKTTRKTTGQRTSTDTTAGAKKASPRTRSKRSSTGDAAEPSGASRKTGASTGKTRAGSSSAKKTTRSSAAAKQPESRSATASTSKTKATAAKKTSAPTAQKTSAKKTSAKQASTKVKSAKTTASSRGTTGTSSRGKASGRARSAAATQTNVTKTATAPKTRKTKETKAATAKNTAPKPASSTRTENTSQKKTTAQTSTSKTTASKRPRQSAPRSAGSPAKKSSTKDPTGTARTTGTPAKAASRRPAKQPDQTPLVQGTLVETGGTAAKKQPTKRKPVRKKTSKVAKVASVTKSQRKKGS